MRLFLAIDLPLAILQHLTGLQAQLTEGRKVPAEQLHLTLNFLGETPEATFITLKERLSDFQFSSFDLRLQGVGSFPPKRPARVLWVGTTPCPELLQLKDQLDTLLKGLKFKLEKRPFHPHITLARFKSPPKHLKSFLDQNSAFQTEPFTIKEFHLYSSQLTPLGAIHHREMSVGLAWPNKE